MRTRWLVVGALVLVVVAVQAAPCQNVALRAYINVSSGCQADTVDFINGLKAKYKPSVSLEMIDFGDRGAGMQRWQQSGHRCMTIELNGSALVKFPVNGKTRIVGFLMPVGFNWTHGDLERAVQAGLQGQLQRATAAEVEAAAPPRQLSVTVSAGSVTSNGRRFATVLIGGAPAIHVPGPAADADRRARAAVVALRMWLSKPVKMPQLTAQQVSGGWKVLANGKGVIVATTADGRVYGQQPQAVAQGWVSSLKHTLALASR